MNIQFRYLTGVRKRWVQPQVILLFKGTTYRYLPYVCANKTLAAGIGVWAWVPVATYSITTCSVVVLKPRTFATTIGLLGR